MTTPAELPEALHGARPIGEYLDAVRASVTPLGFTPSRTLAAVSICRDELTQHLMEDVAARWGAPFALGGLGGLPSLGRTGWGACLSHVPHRRGRGKFLVFGLPHLGIGPRGALGHSLRREQDAPTPTCGALDSILGSWHTHPPAGPDRSGLADSEALRLRMLLEQELREPPVDIMELTLAAAAAVRREMTLELDALAPWSEMDVAVFIGVQIHVPDQVDHIMEITAQHRGEDGSVSDIALS